MKDSWGVIQEFKLEADTLQALRAAVSIACVEHNSGVTHYRVEQVPVDMQDLAEVEDLNGANRLVLMWHRDRETDNGLPFELTTVDEITTFIANWLDKKGTWPHNIPDTDGSTEQGFRAETSYSPFYTFLKITPVHIVYGK